MSKPVNPKNECDPQQTGCLLRRLAEDSGNIPDDTICPHCQQSVQQLDSFAAEVGEQLSHQQATRQQIARRALEQVGIRYRPDELTQTSSAELTQEDDSND